MTRDVLRVVTRALVLSCSAGEVRYGTKQCVLNAKRMCAHGTLV